MSEASSSHEFRPDLDREFQYLLGQMPRVDRETFQGILIENPEVSERVLEAENELYDAWARGDLPRDWQPIFEERMLSTPEGRRKATIARTLAAVATAEADQSRRKASSFGNLSTWMRRIAAAFCAVTAIGVLLWLRRPANEPPSAPPVSTPQQTASLQIETLRLQSITRGSADRPKFRIGASATAIQFALPEAPPAKLELANLAENRTVWKGRATDTAPVSLLPPGQYLLTVFEKESDAQPSNYYEFEILDR